MSYDNHGTVGLDDTPCCYGASKLQCRGPKSDTSEPYVAILGGTETYGKFVSLPFATLLGTQINRPVVNLGCVNAGVDSFLKDPDIMSIAANAELCVVQVMAAHNLSNRLYRVHSRRNDRFLAASEIMHSIYTDVDFTEFAFNKHMLGTLKTLSPQKFEVIQEELKMAWLGRMKALLEQLPDRVVLLWLKYADSTEDCASADLGTKPAFVTEEMVSELRAGVSDVVEMNVRPARSTGDLLQMQIPPMQIPAAEHMLGPAAHNLIAQALTRALKQVL